MVIQRNRIAPRSTVEKARRTKPGLASCLCIDFGRIITPISGVNRTATIHDRVSDIAMTTKSEKVYSPALELLKPIGRKPATVTSVPDSIGKAIDVQAKLAAFSRVSPISIRETIVSMAIIASSTRRPRAMMSAPSEMRWRFSPAYSMPMKVMARTSGIDSVTTNPARKPRLMKLTASTIATASNNAWVKPPTDSSTTAP